MGYNFRHVDTDNEDVVELLTELHTLTFGSSAPLPVQDNDWYGWWWIGWEARSAVPAAFCGLVQSTLGPEYGYLKRAGVIHGHQGNGLQRRMIRVRERMARRLGYTILISDTTDNHRSANNLIAEGYRLWTPEPWAWEHSLYWRKFL